MCNNDFNVGASYMDKTNECLSEHSMKTHFLSLFFIGGTYMSWCRIDDD